MAKSRAYRVQYEDQVGANVPSQVGAYRIVRKLRADGLTGRIKVWVREAGSDRWGLFEVLEVGD